MKERFCAYCRKFRENVGFKTMVSHPSGARRYMCTGCQEMRKKSHSELQALAERDKSERKKK